jgi:formylglycine-generating enzyme required for sulfatase activity
MPAMQRTIVVSAMLLVATFGVRAQDKKFPDPTPRKAEILKLFAEEFVPLAPGDGRFPASFMMGSPAKDNEKPPHKVTFSYKFAIAKYEVTQELYHVVMGSNPAKWRGLRNAIEMVSWDEANEFCDKATKLLRESKLIDAGERIRLPSEAEWEYACRAGTTTAWSHGDDEKELGEYCWYKPNAPGNDPPVGRKKPNPWGLYDIHGYNHEWVADDWDTSYEGAPSDGSARRVKKAAERVLRGGSYADPADLCRSAWRGHGPPGTRHPTIGFRCVKSN